MLALLVLVYVLACATIWKFQSRFIFYPVAELTESPAAYGLPFHDVTIPTHNGTLLGWWMPASPVAPVILYLHGNGGNIGAYAGQASRLRNLGYSVLIFDYRGYGQSFGPFPSESRVYEDAESVWRWLTQASSTLQPANDSLLANTRQGIDPDQICIYGHSLGGAVAIELASHHPEAAALIVESSFTSALAMGHHLRIFRAFPLRALLDHRFDSFSKLSQISMPVLFLHGTRDLTVPCRMSRELFAAASDPKHLVMLSGASHTSCGETGPILYAKTIENFILAACSRTAYTPRLTQTPGS